MCSQTEFLIFNSSADVYHPELINCHLGDEGRVAGEVILPHRIVFPHRPLGEPLLRLRLVLSQPGVPRVLAWGRQQLGNNKHSSHSLYLLSGLEESIWSPWCLLGAG